VYDLNYATEAIDVPCPEGKIIKMVKTIKPVLGADLVISIPKLKTHMMIVYSGAVKNMFGIIPCPPKVIEMRDGKPAADLARCIRCFCCNELCAHGSVSIVRPWFIRIVLR
jgi:uncharacterized protein (DUF362 family)